MEGMLLWSKQQMQHFRPSMKNIPVDSLFEYLKKFFGELGFDPIGLDPMTMEWTGNLISCIDCRLQGGAKIAPSYWPN